MTEYILIGLGLVVLLGFLSQWISWRLKIPSILLLLLFGIIAGPVLGLLHPDKLLGDVLIPFVSISVAIILFEGGLTLKISEFKEIGGVVILLISLGALISWAVGTAAAYWLYGLNLKVAVLLGAVLVVTGPTVMKPLLRSIRPKQSVGKVLKWEGILIDPIGVVLAVLVFEAILIGEVQAAAVEVLLSLLRTVILGFVIGWAFAWLLTLLIRKYWIPDYLQEAAALTAVVVAYFISDYFQEESGLLTATIMGIVLANQKYISIKKIRDFKENLTVMMIPVLFILLSARLTISDIKLIEYSGIAFLAVLIFVGRPLSVFLSSIRSGLKNNEKLFIAWMAPRGIVAAALSSVIALKLGEANTPQVEYLVPSTFLVIIGTVVIYGLTSPLLAKVLKISQSNPRGVLVAGAQEWAQQIAGILKDNDFHVMLIDTNIYNVNQAKMKGLDAYHESIISEGIVDNLNFDGIGKMIALTSNDEVNALATLHFSEIFDNENLYQLQPDSENKDKTFIPLHLRGRFLFPKGINYNILTRQFSRGAVFTSTRLTGKFNYEDFKKKYGNSLIPLFLIDKNKNLQPVTLEEEIKAEEGATIIAMVEKMN